MDRRRQKFRDLVRTPWGWAGAVYSERGLQGFVLPRAEREETEALLETLCGPVEKSRPWAALREQLREYFAGRRDALSLPLDVTAPGEFTGRVWREAGEIPPGMTETYGEIARRAGRRGAARAVGQAMRRNPVPLFIPCHRVVGASGPGGFAGSSSPGMKTRLLALEAGAGEEKRVARKKGLGRR